MSRIMSFMPPLAVLLYLYWLKLWSDRACPLCQHGRPRATIIDPILRREWELRYER
jgi:hypothetical protein